MSTPILQVRDFTVEFWVDGVLYPAAIKMNFDVRAGQTLAIVGESGSGKSTTALGVMNLLAFTNNRGRGILQGTYISNNEKGTRDCGGGKVYLEKEGLIKKIANSVVKTVAKNANTKNAIRLRWTVRGTMHVRMNLVRN